jgi:hypothetical protein
VAVSYSKDVPSFGPPLPKKPLFLKSKEFKEFLLAKIINADNVGLRCGKFTQIRMRTRNDTIKDLVNNYSTKFNLDNCGNGVATNSMAHKFSLFNFGSIKQKKIRSKSLQMFNNNKNNDTEESKANSTNHYVDDKLAYNLSKLNGAIFWEIDFIEDFQYGLRNCCYLGMSKQNLVVVDPQQKCVLFSIGCNAVIGWTLNDNDNSFVLYFDQGECVYVRFKTRFELYNVIKRLEYFTKGCKVNTSFDICTFKKCWNWFCLNTFIRP